MSVGSVVNFVDVLRQHRILEQDKLDELSRLQSSFPDPRQLAKNLLQRGWLTPYQINQIMAGRGGDLSMGQYVVLERLGEGGMGQVFKARHRRMDRTVALKVIRKDHINSPDAVKRFRREMQATASLSHPNIVTALDADQVGDHHFFVMEYVEGVDLGSLIKRMGPPPVAQACDYIRQAAQGLQHAAEKGMVHRDIKPSNLLVSRPAEGSIWGNTIKILDMGVARLQDSGDGIDSLSALTKEGRVVGTPDYMAPEQAANSAKADIRSDLYSLGCSFYNLLTGQPPFPGGTPMEKLLKHRIEIPKPVDSLRPEVPPTVAAIVQRLMAKKPEERFQTPSELVKALDAVMSGKGANHVAPAWEPAATTMRQIPVLRPGVSRPPFKRWPLVLGASLLILAGLAVLIYVLVSYASRKPTSPSRAEGNEEPANPALREFHARASDAKGNVDALRRDLLHFRLEQAGTDDSLEAARIFMRLPSPLDDLKHDNVPAEARLAPEVVAVLGDQRQRHWGPVAAITTSPTLGLVASGGSDAVIHLWDQTSMQPRGVLACPGPVRWLDILPDGQTLVALIGENTIRFWDNLTTAKPRERSELATTVQGRIDAAALAPDGRTLAVSNPTGGAGFGIVRLFDLDGYKDGKRPRQRTMVNRHQRVVRALTFSADGQALAGADDATIIVWDATAATPSERRTITTGDNRFAITALAFGRGKTASLLAYGGTDQVVHVYDLAKPEGTDALNLKGHNGRINALLFVPGEVRLVSACEDRSQRLWDLGTGNIVTQSPKGGLGVNALAMTNNRLYTAGQDTAVRSWMLTPQMRETPPLVAEPTGVVTGLAFLPDGRHLVSANDGDQPPRLWSLAPELKMAALGSQGGTGFYLASSLDGLALAACSVFSNRVLLYRGNEAGTYAPQELPQQSGPGAPRIFALAISADGKTVATGNPDGSVRLCQVGSPKPQSWRVLTGHTAPVIGLAFAPDGKTLASTDDRFVRRWDVTAGKELAPPLNENSITALTYAPDGRTLALAARDGGIRLYDVSAEKPRLRTTPRWARSHARAIGGLAYSPDGSRIASGAQDGEVLVLNTAGGSLVHHWQLGGPVRALSYAADGRHLATGNGNGSIYVFRLK
jgi:serine/threonine protein kinase/WD40 repeat protein